MRDYGEWLKDAVGKLCNAEGAYEVWWDYDERVEPSHVHEAVQKYADEGYTSPQAYLECVTFQDAADYHQREFLRELEEMADVEDGAVADEFRRAMDEGDVWDDLDRAGFKGVDLMMESALQHSRIDVNLLFATKEELNHDTCSIVDAFGSAYGSPQVDRLDAGDLDNALSYLVNQQGYSVGDLYAALDDAMIDSQFIQSVAEEIDGELQRVHELPHGAHRDGRPDLHRALRDGGEGGTRSSCRRMIARTASSTRSRAAAASSESPPSATWSFPPS